MRYISEVQYILFFINLYSVISSTWRVKLIIIGFILANVFLVSLVSQSHPSYIMLNHFTDAT